MKGEVRKYVLVDSCFWFGLFWARDSFHTKALQIFEKIERQYAVVAWPILYEVMNTKFAKGHETMARLASELRSPGIHLIGDEKYRQQALDDSFALANRRRPMSLVDRVLRAVATDTNVRVDAIATFNPGDFADVCRERRIELLST